MTVCAICMHSLTPPVKVLVCGHSFCQLCASYLITANGITNNNGFVPINCPTCRRETLLYEGQIHLLPTNFALNILLEKRQNANENQSKKQQTENDVNGQETIVDSTRPGLVNDGNDHETSFDSNEREIVEVINGQEIAEARNDQEIAAENAVFETDDNGNGQESMLYIHEDHPFSFADHKRCLRSCSKNHSLWALM